jgi:hypothetical protein
MKINEILSEAGFWRGVAKGVGKGVADLVAPGAVDQFKKSGAVDQFKKSIGITRSKTSASPNIDAYLSQMKGSQPEVDPRVQGIFDDLYRKAQAQGNTINFDDIKKAFSAGLTESTDAGEMAILVAKMLLAKGIKVVGAPPEATTTDKLVSFGNTQVPVGHRLKIVLPSNKQTYYKYPNGTWYWLAIAALPKGSTINPLQQVPANQADQLDGLTTLKASAVFEKLPQAKKSR